MAGDQRRFASMPAAAFLSNAIKNAIVMLEHADSSDRSKRHRGSENKCNRTPQLIEQHFEWARLTKNSLRRTIVYIMRAVTEQ
jgi:hypothetical protein